MEHSCGVFGQAVEVGAAGIGEPVALEAAIGPVRDRPLDEPVGDEGVKVAASVARLVAQSHRGQHLRTRPLRVAEQGEDREPAIVGPCDLAT